MERREADQRDVQMLVYLPTPSGEQDLAELVSGPQLLGHSQEVTAALGGVPHLRHNQLLPTETAGPCY